jgi:NAD(P)H-nitrite reductase large subunit
MKIIIIGSGIAGVTFAEKARELMPEASITLLTRETYGYYSRPMLSRGFSKENIEKTIVLKPFNKLLEKNICIISGVDVTGINREKQSIDVKGIDENEELEYDKLVLATGSAAFIPPPFTADRNNFYLFNSLKDLKQLRKLRQTLIEKQQKPHWAIIGGGLIGCELASDLAVSGDQVTLFHAMDRLMERQLVEEDSETLKTVMQSSGINVLFNQAVQGFPKMGTKVGVTVNDNLTEFDAVVVSCGFKPRTDLAAKANLSIGRGIKVNQTLQTSDENIVALGDVAEFPNGKLYAFISPIRNQALWLANFLSGQESEPWTPPVFDPKAKVHGFEAAHPYLF